MGTNGRLVVAHRLQFDPGMRTDRRRRDDELRLPEARSEGARRDADPVGGGSGVRSEALDSVEPALDDLGLGAPIAAEGGLDEALGFLDAPAADREALEAARALALVEVSDDALPARVGPLASYLDAARLREDLSLLGTDASRSAARPEGISTSVWNPSLALSTEGIDEADVARFAVEGRLSDRIDPTSGALITGEARLARLEASAEDGSWTAVNTLTFLVGARRSALAASAASGADPEATATADRALSRSLHGTFARATTGRERRAETELRLAADLERRASVALDSGDEVTARSLEAEADRRRDRALSGATAETAYRRREHRAGFDAAGTLALSAEVELAGASAEVGRAGRRGEAPAVLPESLARGEALIGEARTADVEGRHVDRLLELDGRRLHTTGDFHLLRADHAEPGPPRGIELGAYFDARIAEVRGLDDRIELRASDPSADLAGLELTWAELDGELGEFYGRALVADRIADEAGTTATELEESAESTRTAAENEADAITTSREAVEVARDRNAPLIPWMRTEEEERRDEEAVLEEELTLGGHELRAEVLADRADRLERASTTARTGADDARATAERLASDALVLSLALGRFELSTTPRLEAGWDAMRGSADRHLARSREALAGSTDTPPAEAAALHLALSEHEVRAARIDLGARGEEGRERAEGRLDRARTDVGAAEAAVVEAPRSDRSALMEGAISVRCALAVTEAGVRPGLAATDLDTALEDMSGLAGRPRAEAREMIGASAIEALVIADAHFDEIVEAGDYAPEAADHFHALGHRMLDRHAAIDADGEASRARMAEVDEAIVAAGRVFDAAAGELEAGRSVVEEEARAITRASVSAGQARVPGFISGPVWAVSATLAAAGLGETVDVREIEAQMRERELHGDLGMVRIEVERHAEALAGTAEAYRAARAEGRPLEMLGAIRIISGERGEAYDAAVSWLVDRTDDQFLSYLRSEVHEGTGVASAALGGSLFGLADAAARADDELILARLPARAEDMALGDVAARLRRDTDGLGTVLAINVAFEVALGLALTGGVGSARAVVAAESTVEAVSLVARAAAAVRALRAAHPVLTAVGEATVLGAAQMGASHLTRATFGESSAATRFVDGAMAFVPMGASVRAAEAGYAASIAIGAAQAGLTTRYAPDIAEGLGIGGEGGTALVSLGLGALVAGGLAWGATRWRARSVAETVRALEASGRLDPADAPAMRRALEAFALETEGRDLTEADLTGLAERVAPMLSTLEEASGPRAVEPVAEGPMSALSDVDLQTEIQDFFAAIPAPARAQIQGELSGVPLGTWRRVFGDGSVPEVAVALGNIPGFGAFMAAHPAEARAIALNSVAFPALPGLLRQRVLGGATLEAAVAAVAPRFVTEATYTPIPGYVRVRRGSGSPDHVPEIAIRPAGEAHDHNGAFHVPSFRGGRARTHLPDVRGALPEQIVIHNSTRTSMDGVLVFAGHGSSEGISGHSPERVAALIADEILAPGAPNIDVVLLRACQQRDTRLLIGRSSAVRVQRELSRLLAAAGHSDVTVVAASRPGVTYGPGIHYDARPIWDLGGSGQEHFTLPHVRDGRLRITRYAPTEYAAADYSSMPYAERAALGAAAATLAGSGYLVYRAVDELEEREERFRALREPESRDGRGP